MAKAGAGAYSQLQRVGNYVAPQVNKAADRLNQQGMQQKQIKAEAGARKEARDESWRLDTQTDFSNFEYEATGNTGRDDMFKIAADKGIERAESYFRQARELRATDPNKADMMKAKGRAIQSSFKNLAADSAIVKEMFDGYAEAYASGKIKEGAYRSFMNGLSRNEAVPYLDDNDQWRVRVMVRDETSGEILKDENGEVKYEDKSLSEIKKGLDKPYDFNEVHGKDGELNKVLTSMGKNKWDEINGQFIDTKQEFGAEQERSLNDFIEGTLGSDREMYKWYYYATGKEKLKGFNTADKEKITNYINTSVKGAYGKEATKKVTPTTQEEKEETATTLNTRKKEAAGLLAAAKVTAADKAALNAEALARFKAENPTKKKLTKAEEQQEGNKLAYEIALKIANVTGETDAERDAAINVIGKEYGLNTSANNDWWGRNEFNLDDNEKYQDDPHAVAEAIADKMGYDYDAKYAQAELTKKLEADKAKKPTPEEAKVKAQSLIDKYSKKAK